MARRVLIRHSPLALAVLFVAASAAAYTTLAFFNDVEPVGPVGITAGALDLDVDHPDWWDAFVTHVNFAPGDVAEGTLHLRNTGTIRTGDAEGHLVLMTIVASTTSEDAHGGETDLPAWLQVEAFTYGDDDLVHGLADHNRNGWTDLEDLAATTIHDLADPDDGTPLTLTIRFHPTAGNHLEGDTTVARLAFTLTQL